MAEYTITSPKWEAEIRLKYHENGFLASAEMPEVIDQKSAEFFATRFPVHESLIEWYRANTGATITKIDADTSFDAFWNAYANKRGSKDNAQLYWEGSKKTINRRPVTLTDRQDIMGMVKKYARRHMGDKKEFQPLATSFLHGRMWVAELEAAGRKGEVDLRNLFK